jgi:hypothetical protein
MRRTSELHSHFVIMHVCVRERKGEEEEGEKILTHPCEK